MKTLRQQAEAPRGPTNKTTLFFGYPIYDYEWEIEDTPAEYNDMVPIAPNH